ncbi:hypothetical protein Pcinc_034625 [Petrolisthes cinctipes]|uniref:Uncharacterized protein n=1 Tax=Petrolisthes cinctipes TaxID=88211 RepID=A0AAE1BYD4_PETCI|nr:hypothetical protein Pcinc_034625 [Petrolisthes cinctipes]
MGQDSSNQHEVGTTRLLINAVGASPLALQRWPRGYKASQPTRQSDTLPLAVHVYYYPATAPPQQKHARSFTPAVIPAATPHHHIASRHPTDTHTVYSRLLGIHLSPG